jgi:phosphoglycolate phosphatase-like HAD superfamily hydrolase
MIIRNYIWDFDGMLFDTYPHTVAVFCEIMRQNGKPVDPQEAYDKFKVTMWHAFEYYGFTDEAEVQRFYALENDIDFPPVGRPFDGVPDVLREITRRGGRSYLYTHRDKVAMEYLDRYGLTDLFSGFVTSEDDFPHKPAPDAILHIVKTYGLDPAETLMLGDRDIDVGSGVNAGIPTLLFDNENRYTDVGQTYTCRTVGEILDFVKAAMPEE